MAESRYVFRKADDSTYTLPEDARVSSGDGETLNVRLERAVETSEWEDFGDGRPVPTPLVLTFQITATSETAASATATALWLFVQAARRLERDGRVYRPYLAAQSCTVEHLDGDQHNCTLTLLPSGSQWLSITDHTPRLF